MQATRGTFFPIEVKPFQSNPKDYGTQGYTHPQRDEKVNAFVGLMHQIARQQFQLDLDHVDNHVEYNEIKDLEGRDLSDLLELEIFKKKNYLRHHGQGKVVKAVAYLFLKDGKMSFGDFKAGEWAFVPSYVEHEVLPQETEFLMAFFIGPQFK